MQLQGDSNKTGNLGTHSCKTYSRKWHKAPRQPVSWLDSLWPACQLECKRILTVAACNTAGKEGNQHKLSKDEDNVTSLSSTSRSRKPRPRKKHHNQNAQFYTKQIDDSERADKQLGFRIKQASTLADLTDILSQDGARMNQRHITAFLVQVCRHAQAARLVFRPSSRKPEKDDYDDHELNDVAWNPATVPASTQGEQDNQPSSTTSMFASNKRQKQYNNRSQPYKVHAGAVNKSAGLQQKQLNTICLKVAEILQSLLFELDSRGIVTVMYSLAKLRVRHTITEDLMYVSMQCFDELDGQGFSNLIYAACQLRIKPSREWLTAFFRASQPILHTFSDQAIANTVWALAKLGLAPSTSTSSREWEKTMYSLVGEWARNDNCNPQALSLMVWSVAKMDLFPPDHVLDLLSEMVERRLPELGTQGIVNAVWGLSRLRCQLSHAWWIQVMKATQDSLPSWDAEAISTLLYSMALSGHMPACMSEETEATAPVQLVISSNTKTNSNQTQQRTSDKAVANNAPPSRAAAEVQPHSMQTSMTSDRVIENHGQESVAQLEYVWGNRFSARLIELLPRCSPQTLAVVTYSLGRLRAKPSQQLLQALLTASEAALDQYTPQGLANTAWGLAKVGVMLQGSWVNAFLTATYQKMPLMGQQELSNMLWGLAQLRVWPDSLWMSCYEKHSLRLMHDFEPQSLSSTIHSFAMFGYMPGREWRSAFCTRLENILLKMLPVQLADTLWAVAKLGIAIPADTGSRMAAGIAKNMATITGNDVASALYASTRLHLGLSSEALSLYVDELGMQMHELSLNTLAQVVWSLASFGYLPSPTWLQQLDTLVVKRLQPSNIQSNWGDPRVPSKDVASSHLSGRQAAVGDVFPHAQAHLEGICQYVTARPRLGPLLDHAVPRAILEYAMQPSILNSLTAPQLLVLIQGISGMGFMSQSDLHRLFADRVQADMQRGMRYSGLHPVYQVKQLQPVNSRPLPPQLPVAS